MLFHTLPTGQTPDQLLSPSTADTQFLTLPVASDHFTHDKLVVQYQLPAPRVKT
jgi:hypothetical protein